VKPFHRKPSSGGDVETRVHTQPMAFLRRFVKACQKLDFRLRRNDSKDTPIGVLEASEPAIRFAW